jgi:lipoyl(octanoyl) transferase
MTIDLPATDARSTGPDLAVRDLGRMSYAAALDLQRCIHQEVIERRHRGGGGMTLLLLEHDPPVITITRRPGAAAHLLAGPDRLRAAGVVTELTDRGGDITYHGPGQLVAYPILDLHCLGLRLNAYMRLLEQVVIDTLAAFGIEGFRDPAPGMTGVWVRPSSGHGDAAGPAPPAAAGAPRPPAKIAALGVRISRWVSMHGLAVNVSTNLDHFDLIVPCGLAGRGVTSMERELGEQCPAMEAVRHELIARFRSALGDLQPPIRC